MVVLFLLVIKEEFSLFIGRETGEVDISERFLGVSNEVYYYSYPACTHNFSEFSEKPLIQPQSGNYLLGELHSSHSSEDELQVKQPELHSKSKIIYKFKYYIILHKHSV